MEGREGELLPPRCAPPFADSGRSFITRGEFCAGAFVGRFELPDPCGARPRSVTVPCASQARELFPTRGAELFPVGLFMDRPEFGIAEGGRFCETPPCRGDGAELLGAFPKCPLVLDEPFEFGIGEGGRFCEG